MKKQILLLYLMISWLKVFSIGNDVVKPTPDCKGLPKYLNKTRFSLNSPFGFSVGEKESIGLSLVQFATNESAKKIFRFPSWDIAGYLGGVVTDKDGNSYVIPRPFINTLNNDPAKQNIIYKVRTDDGLMQPLISLSEGYLQNINENPYGLMGLTYDCETELVYASSIYGSDIDNERGVIYSIKTGESVKVVDKATNIDAIGLGIAYVNNKKYLFYGCARNSDIYHIEISKEGVFVRQSQKALSIQGLGTRGDDKPRKIRFNDKGEMLISGMNFNFNLANQDSATEHIYRFKYNDSTSRWQLVGVEEGQQ